MLHTIAPAKLNLYLHVTGRRADGYHMLDSLVGFADVGDRLTLEASDQFSFVLDGPMAGALQDEDQSNNLVVRAVHALGMALNKKPDFKITLTKNLPIASGIGGGSADAAAALRLMAAYWGMAPNAPMLYEIAGSLGQDVPCCLTADSCYFEGIGDRTSFAPELPYCDIVLVNSNESVVTPKIFAARKGEFSAPAPRLHKPLEDVDALVSYLAPLRNDLAAPAMELCLIIKPVLENLESQEGCLLSRMLGSGATCFGLFADRGMAKQAMSQIHRRHPEWWVVQAHTPIKSPVVMEL